MISAINVVPHPTNKAKEVMITGGTDNKINVYVLVNGDIKEIASYTVTSTPRSVDFMG